MKILNQFSPDELTRLRHLRYKVYIEELGYQLKHTDHVNQLVFDEYDQSGHLIGAFDKDQCIGTVLILNSAIVDVQKYYRLYDLGKLSYLQTMPFYIIKKLMIDKDYRSKKLVYRLGAACFKLGLSEKVRYAFIDCDMHLIGFYERLGFEKIKEIKYLKSGNAMLMRFDAYDLTKLLTLKSPILGYLSVSG